LLLRRAVQQCLAGDPRHAPLVVQLLLISTWYHACVSERRSVRRPFMSRVREGTLPRQRA
jgi:hypothetical protein